MIGSQIIFFIVGFLIIGIKADVSEIVGRAQSAPPLPQLPENPVTDICLGCICEASSDCNRTLTCEGQVCGLFRITWAYWSDAGKPTFNNESPDSQTAYPNCVTEPFCAARTVQGYMRRFGTDCNNDGTIDCNDFAAIHKNGGYGCNAPLPDWYRNKFETCVSIAKNYG